MSNILLIARRQLGAMREDRYVVLLGLVVALGVVSVLGDRPPLAIIQNLYREG